MIWQLIHDKVVYIVIAMTTRQEMLVSEWGNAAVNVRVMGAFNGHLEVLLVNRLGSRRTTGRGHWSGDDASKRRVLQSSRSLGGGNWI